MSERMAEIVAHGETVTRIAQKVANVLEPYRGQTLLGIVDGHHCVEIVFSKGDSGYNLLTLWFEDDELGTYSNGAVMGPEGYADRCRVRAEG